MTVLRLDIPGLRIVSEANERGRWFAGAKRSADQRALVGALLSRHRPLPVPAIVRMVRVAPARLDADNLGRAFKAVQDEVASWLGVDDGNPVVEWHVGQQKGAPKEYGVRLHVRAVSPTLPHVRMREVALETQLDATLDAPTLARIAEALGALARGKGTHVNFNIGEARFAFRRAEGERRP